MLERENELPTHREASDQVDGLEAIKGHSSIEVYRALAQRVRRSFDKKSMSSVAEVGQPDPRIDARTRPTIRRRTGIRFH